VTIAAMIEGLRAMEARNAQLEAENATLRAQVSAPSDSTPSPAPTDSGAEPARGEGASLMDALRTLAAAGWPFVPVELCYHPSADPGDGSGWVLVIGGTHHYGTLDKVATQAAKRAAEVSDG